jgi:putative acetyltransferase
VNSIRSEEPRDRHAVRRINEAAFGGPAEANLVEALHRVGAAVVALVAERDGEVVGHILFSPVSVDPATPKRLVGLAPMAVAPEFQRRGIGTLLVGEGLDRCRSAGAEAVVVLGHADYYPRFGFRPAGNFGLRCEYDVPPEVFMALELVPDSLRDVSGVVKYHQAFRDI